MNAHVFTPRQQLLAVQAEMCERSLIHFVKSGWSQIEPLAFQANWHLDAIAEHLEAVANRQIKRLLINIPPRHGKSLVANVFFPAWVWAQNAGKDEKGRAAAVMDGAWRGPGVKFMHLSYAADLSSRDSVKCRRLIDSRWYQDRWGNRFDFAADQNQKLRFENTRGGHRISTSVGGKVTGDGGDIICFPAEEIVWTENGPAAIGDLVLGRVRTRVWSANVATGEVSLKPIGDWYENAGSAIVRVVLDDGASFRCTPDHKIWTHRGWVAAQDLEASDKLPVFAPADGLDRCAVNAVERPSLTATEGTLDDFENLRIREQRAFVALASEPIVGGAGGIVCDVPPVDAAADKGNRAGGDAVALRKLLGGTLRILRNGLDLRLRELRAGALLVKRKRTMLLGVGDVLGARSVLKIAKASVASVAVLVANLLAGRRKPDEGARDLLMHEEVPGLSVNADVEARVSFVRRRFERLAAQLHCFALPDHDAVDRADATEAGNLVRREGGYRSPLLVERVGHSSKTYCLNINDHHTFFVGSGKVLVRNCFDDPHNVKDGESQVEREGVLRFWDESMPTRLNDAERGAFVVNMQRVHEKDLSGHIIAKDMGWTHLCLPAICEIDHPHPVKTIVVNKKTGEPWSDDRAPGEPLWLERFKLPVLENWAKEMGSYAWAGQGQQRPAPREGGIFKREWFDIVPAAPASAIVKVRSWDIAGTEEAVKTDPDYTVGLKMSRDPMTGLIYIEDVRRFRETPAKVKQNVKTTATQDRQIVPIRIPLDPGAAGKFTAADFVSLLVGWTVRAEKEDGTKEMRADPFAAQCEVRNVKLVAGPWNEAFLEEMCSFPKGAHDDQVDAATAAFRCIADFANPTAAVGRTTSFR